MTRRDLNGLRWLEGLNVNVSLRDGSRLDDCQLISVGRNDVRSLWLFTNGADHFVHASDVLDLCESIRRN